MQATQKLQASLPISKNHLNISRSPHRHALLEKLVFRNFSSSCPRLRSAGLCQSTPLPYAVAVPEDAEWFTHMHEMGLPQSLSLQVAGTLVGAFAASRLLSLVADSAAKRVRESKERGMSLGALLATIVMAVQRPACFYLPVKAMLRCAVLLVHALERHAHILAAHDTPKWQIKWLEGLCDGIRGVDQMANKSFNVTLLALGMWAVVRLKDVAVKIILDRAATGDIDPDERPMDNILLPLSALATWAAVAAGLLMLLKVLGLDIRPLLAAGGLGGVVLGLATQSLLANALAGLHLIAVRPMVVGERVSVTSSAQTITGIVERIDFLRTVIRTDAYKPYWLPNKVLVDAVICNESRVHLSTARSTYSHTRQLEFQIRLRYSDINRVEGIVDAMRNYFRTECQGCEKALPMSVALSEALSCNALTISVRVNSTPLAARGFSEWRQEVLLHMHRIVTEAGARVAPSVADLALPS